MRLERNMIFDEKFIPTKNNNDVNDYTDDSMSADDSEDDSKIYSESDMPAESDFDADLYVYTVVSARSDESDKGYIGESDSGSDTPSSSDHSEYDLEKKIVCPCSGSDSRETSEEEQRPAPRTCDRIRQAPEICRASVLRCLKRKKEYRSDGTWLRKDGSEGACIFRRIMDQKEHMM